MNRQEIAKHLRFVADQMHSVGVMMDYYGGLDQEMTAKAREIIGASQIARSWAESIENETNEGNESENIAIQKAI